MTLREGMLTSAETVHVVAAALRRYKVPTSVVDPVQLTLPMNRSQAEHCRS